MQIVKNRSATEVRCINLMQLNAILSLSKLIAQSEERCVYVKSDAQVNGLMKI